MTLRDWRELRNHLQTLACTVSIYSKEYANLCKRIKWINDNKLTWKAKAKTGEVIPF